MAEDADDAEPLTLREWAAAGVVTLLVLGIVLWDSDTLEAADVPGVRVFACRHGTMGAEAYDAQAPRGQLTRPQAGVYANATVDGQLAPARLELWTREPGGRWERYQFIEAQNGQDLFVIYEVPPGLEAYVRAVDPDGRLCAGESERLRAPDA